MNEKYFHTIDELLIDSKKSPLPLEVIPNNMGINLCAVHGISWKRQKDGQLVDLTIHFIPSEEIDE